MDETWTIRRTLDWTTGYLAEKGDENPLVSAQWLLSAATGLSRMDLYVQFDRPLSREERDILRSGVRRRATGEPLQYITGETGFRHITLIVRPGVLIPRPETEVLVSEALALLPPLQDEIRLPFFSNGTEGFAEKDSAPDPGEPEADVDSADETSKQVAPANTLLVADLCTGSGCIACSLAFERPDIQVVATDISPCAIALAQDNADALGLDERIELITCDLGEGIDTQLLGMFDAVVSNPPYVPTAVLAELPREVADFEPALALDGGADGLDFLRRILAFASVALKPGGGLAVELHETCLDTAAALAREAGFEDVRIAKDLAGRPRILTARLSC